MAINEINNTINFCALVGDEKEMFIRNLVRKHLDLARFMANYYCDSILLCPFDGRG